MLFSLCFTAFNSSTFSHLFDILTDATTIDATTAVNSDEIFGVDIWDDEMDQISFSMTTNPAGGPFDILDCKYLIVFKS